MEDILSNFLSVGFDIGAREVIAFSEDCVSTDNLLPRRSDLTSIWKRDEEATFDEGRKNCSIFDPNTE